MMDLLKLCSEGKLIPVTEIVPPWLRQFNDDHEQQEQDGADLKHLGTFQIL